MKWILGVGVLVALYLSAVYVPVELELTFARDYYLNKSDNQDFARPLDKTNSSWEQHRFGSISLYHDNYWLQTTFQLEHDNQAPKAIFISMLGSYEVYWDGQLIGKNGVVGENETTEKAGNIDAIFLLPTENAHEGLHTLSMRISSNHRPDSITESGLWAFVGKYRDLTLLPREKAFAPLMMSGVMLFATFICALLYLKGLSGTKSLIFGLLCLSVFALCITDACRGYWVYTYDWHITRLELIKYLSMAIGGLLVLAVATILSCTRRWTAVAISIYTVMLALLFITETGYDIFSRWAVLLGLAIGVVLSVIEIIRQKSARFVFLLICLSLVIAPFFIYPQVYLNSTFFISFTVLIAAMLYSFFEELQKIKRDAIQQKLKNERLKLELIKKHIQPHFLMNSLTALEELIEQAPHQAVDFIQKLSELFRQLYNMIDRRLISLSDELIYCQVYIDLLNYRNGSNMSLNIEGNNTDVRLPPGILLTLIENAFSHNTFQKSSDILLVSIKTPDEHVTEITLEHPVIFDGKQEHSGNGQGRSYIISRMNEEFKDDWSIKDDVQGENYITTLKMFSYYKHVKECIS
ncbi:sensor histidine kinase [Alteromonas lipolytica]|uniref:Signal transduction histidine kinase internal region domain-containing protein n=1 Tax=Alteromonas lipolytica TaxID=1856405 RepID=A0A1E8FGE3_9ALTE|nr:sensor histidine kinase [Alteromonas lipolytica]OFI34984.1 hypothetical protein BFC17_15600 [Alteromonas lipolytica]GGF55639.1 hypothetical protein GCM10011338_04880 [Alteromonas lipolytica]